MEFHSSLLALVLLQARLPSGLGRLVLILEYGDRAWVTWFWQLERALPLLKQQRALGGDLGTVVPVSAPASGDSAEEQAQAHPQAQAKPGWTGSVTRALSREVLWTQPSAAPWYRVRPLPVLKSAAVALAPVTLYGTGVALSLALQTSALSQLATQVNGSYLQAVETVKVIELQRSQDLNALTKTNEGLVAQRDEALAQFADEQQEMKAQIKVEAQIERLRNTRECQGCVFPPGTDLSGESLVGVNLQGAVLAGCDLSGVNLRGAILAGANLRGAILHNARLTYASFKGADLAGASLVNAHGGSVDWTGANLTRASLENGFFQTSLFVAADLVETNLKGTDVSYSNFERAKVTGVERGPQTHTTDIIKPNGQPGDNLSEGAGRR